MKRWRRSIVASCVLVVLVGIVTFGSAVLTRSLTQSLEERNQEATAIADAEIEVEGLNGLAWAQLAGRTLNAKAVIERRSRAEAALSVARSTISQPADRARIATVATRLRRYARALTDEQQRFRSAINPESTLTPEPHPEYPRIMDTLAELKLRIAQQVGDVSSRLRVTGFVIAAVDFGIVLIVMSSFVAVRRRALQREFASAADARYRALVQEAPDLVLVLDGTGVVTYQSPSAARVLGRGAAAIDGADFPELLHPEDRAAFDQALATLPSHANVTLEVRVGDEHDSWRTIMATVANQLDEPLIAGFVVNAHDVTESRLLEAQLRQSSKLEAVGQLAGGIAHDFNNILCVIQSSVELLADEVTSDTGTQDLAEIASAADRGANLARQILAFSRVEVNTVDVIDLNERVLGMRGMLERTITKSCSLSIACCDQELAVAADPTGVDQVVINLVINARDAVSDGGSIDVITDTCHLDIQQGRTHNLPAGTYARLIVRDDGAGMSDEVAARIFEPFFTTKGAGRGTGLGLATAHGVVRRAAGRITMKSAIGVGTEMTVWFPLSTRAAPSTAPRPVHTQVIPRKRRVLLVEDESPVRNAFQRILTAAGHTVRACEHGPSALAALEDDFDVLVTDMIMPGGMNGRELAQLVRSRAPGIGVIYVSGYSELAVSNRGIIEPGVPLLQKPVSRDALLRAVETARGPTESRSPAIPVTATTS